MPNNYFQFKQFTVQQEKCAMKVCTDACLFGAYAADESKKSKIKIQNVLDIGTGTGLLSLMLAQKFDAVIDAVEIDEQAYIQAKENFEQSPWKERLNIFNEDILHLKTQKKYDCIISNPPFYELDLKSDNRSKNAARHDTALTLQQLLQCADKFLNDDGVFAVLLPYHRVDYFIETATELNLHTFKKILVKQTPSHNFFRGIALLQREKTNLSNEEIIIKDETGNYTSTFAALLKDYYLHL